MLSYKTYTTYFIALAIAILSTVCSAATPAHSLAQQAAYALFTSDDLYKTATDISNIGPDRLAYAAGRALERNSEAAKKDGTKPVKPHETSDKLFTLRPPRRSKLLGKGVEALTGIDSISPHGAPLGIPFGELYNTVSKENPLLLEQTFGGKPVYRVVPHTDVLSRNVLVPVEESIDTTSTAEQLRSRGTEKRKRAHAEKVHSSAHRTLDAMARLYQEVSGERQAARTTNLLVSFDGGKTHQRASYETLARAHENPGRAQWFRGTQPAPISVSHMALLFSKAPTTTDGVPQRQMREVHAHGDGTLIFNDTRLPVKDQVVYVKPKENNERQELFSASDLAGPLARAFVIPHPTATTIASQVEGTIGLPAAAGNHLIRQVKGFKPVQKTLSAASRFGTRTLVKGAASALTGSREAGSEITDALAQLVPSVPNVKLKAPSGFEPSSIMHDLTSPEEAYASRAPATAQQLAEAHQLSTFTGRLRGLAEQSKDGTYLRTNGTKARLVGAVIGGKTGAALGAATGAAVGPFVGAVTGAAAGGYAGHASMGHSSPAARAASSVAGAGAGALAGGIAGPTLGAWTGGTIGSLTGAYAGQRIMGALPNQVRLPKGLSLSQRLYVEDYSEKDWNPDAFAYSLALPDGTLKPLTLKEAQAHAIKARDEGDNDIKIFATEKTPTSLDPHDAKLLNTPLFERVDDGKMRIMHPMATAAALPRLSQVARFKGLSQLYEERLEEARRKRIDPAKIAQLETEVATYKGLLHQEQRGLPPLFFMHPQRPDVPFRFVLKEEQDAQGDNGISRVFDASGKEEVMPLATWSPRRSLIPHLAKVGTRATLFGLLHKLFLTVKKQAVFERLINDKDLPALLSSHKPNSFIASRAASRFAQDSLITLSNIFTFKQARLLLGTVALILSLQWLEKKISSLAQRKKLLSPFVKLREKVTSSLLSSYHNLRDDKASWEDDLVRTTRNVTEGVLDYVKDNGVFGSLPLAVTAEYLITGNISAPAQMSSGITTWFATSNVAQKVLSTAFGVVVPGYEPKQFSPSFFHKKRFIKDENGAIVGEEDNPYYSYLFQPLRQLMIAFYTLQGMDSTYTHQFARYAAQEQVYLKALLSKYHEKKHLRESTKQIEEDLKIFIAAALEPKGATFISKQAKRFGYKKLGNALSYADLPSKMYIRALYKTHGWVLPIICCYIAQPFTKVLLDKVRDMPLPQQIGIGFGVVAITMPILRVLVSGPGKQLFTKAKNMFQTAKKWIKSFRTKKKKTRSLS